MTTGRRFDAQCSRCRQVVVFETTGFPYGPLALPLEHFYMDGKQRLKRCEDSAPLFKIQQVQVEPMTLPNDGIFHLDYLYSKINKDD